MTNKELEEDRINDMIEVVMKVARGDYSAQVELEEDILGSLGLGINMMIDDIREHMTEIKCLQEKEKASAAENARADEAEKYSKDLEAKVKELEEFHDLAVGREIKMKKMEEEMEELKKKLKEKGG